MVSASRLGSRFRVALLEKFISAITGGLLVVLLARLLDPDGYGLLYLTLSIVGVAKLFSKLGVGPSAARYISEYKETDASQTPHIIRFSLLVTGVLMVIVATALVLGNQLIADVLNEPDLHIFILVGAIFLIFKTLAGYTNSILQSFEDIKAASVIKIIKEISKLFCAIGLVLVGFGAIGALVGYLFGVMIGTVLGIAIIYYRYYSKIDRSATMETGLKRRILEYSVPLTMTNTARILDKQIDIVLVGFFLNPVAVSYYVISKQVVQFIEKPASALGFTLAPTFAAEKSKGNIEHASRIYEEAFIHLMLLYTPAAVGIIIIAEPLVELVFGANYLGAIPVLQVLGLYAVLMASNLVANKALNFLGRAKERAIIKGITAIMNVGLNIILIPTIGVVGAALSTIITSSLYSFANFYLIHYELELRLWFIVKKVLLITLISVIMGVGVFLLIDYVEHIITLLLVVGVGISIWGVLVFITGLLDVKKVIRVVL